MYWSIMIIIRIILFFLAGIYMQSRGDITDIVIYKVWAKYVKALSIYFTFNVRELNIVKFHSLI